MGDSESIDGMNALTEDFGSGRIMPTQVVITGDTYVYENGAFNIAYLDAIENLTASIADDSMVQQVTGVTRPYGTTVDYHNLTYHAGGAAHRSSRRACCRAWGAATRPCC